MSACTQKTPNLPCFLKRRLTNTPRRDRLADGQLSSLHPPSPSFSSFGAASVIAIPLLLPLREDTLTAVCVLPEYNQVVNMCIRIFCDHLNVLYIFDQTYTYRFEIRLKLYGANSAPRR